MSHPAGTELQTAVTRRIELEDASIVSKLLGPNNVHARVIENVIADVAVDCRGTALILRGSVAAVDLTSALIAELRQSVDGGFLPTPEDVARAASMLLEDPETAIADIFADTRLGTTAALRVAPKGVAQKQYIDAIRQHDMVFGIGPAGTGKTYLAMAMAVAAFLERRVKRIVLTRPAVEAGEKLGFLPGDIAEKVNPYLRPLYDALHDMLDLRRARNMIERGQIEVAPLAFMRGRTLNGSFVILDEAQNSTSEQMLMFLTRLGYDSKAVITGDVTQVDLPGGAVSGLKEARERLKNVDGISFCTFTEKDVVRHPLVQRIILAYEGR